MMSCDILKRRKGVAYRALCGFLAFTLFFSWALPPGYAQVLPASPAGGPQTLLNLPVPGAMVAPSAAFVPVLLRGMTIHPENPLQFDFIVDSGNTDFKEDRIKTESERLVKYFLASMTIPKDDLWVNLSPYEKDRIIPDELGKTELGRDMLAQDYILKQLTASLMYPEKELGKEFWDKVYKKAQEKYGTTEIPVDTFNKVWILPETATVYEHGQTVYIVEARLKVMLDSDYLAMSHNVTTSQGHKDGTGDVVTGDLVTPQVIREIILPEIEREVNEGKNFAPLRQIYHSLILAKWYKETIKNSLLSKVYVDKKLINGIRLEDGQLKGEDGSIIDSQSSIVDQIYNQYMDAYKKGVFNYIKEDYDRLSREMIPRKYFSGGIDRLTNFSLIKLDKTSNPARVASARVGKHFTLTTRANPQKKDASSPMTKEQAIAMIMETLLQRKHPLTNSKYHLYIGENELQLLAKGNGENIETVIRSVIRLGIIDLIREQLYRHEWHSHYIDPTQHKRLREGGVTGTDLIKNDDIEKVMEYITRNIEFDAYVIGERIEEPIAWVEGLSIDMGPPGPPGGPTTMYPSEWAVRDNRQLIIRPINQKGDSTPPTSPSTPPQSSSPITPREAEAKIKGKLAPEHHHLINDTHVQMAMAYEGNFDVAYHAGPPERIEIVRAKAVSQSSSPINYEREFQNYRKRTDETFDVLSRPREITEDSLRAPRQKFRSNFEKGELKEGVQTYTAIPEDFEGVTTITWVNDRAAEEKIAKLQGEIKSKLERAGLGQKIAFVNPGSFHVTIHDLIVKSGNDNYDQQKDRILEGVQRAFNELGAIGDINVEVKGVGMIDGAKLLMARVYPKTLADFERIYKIKQAISQYTGIDIKPSFVAHITLGYFVNPLNQEEYRRLLGIINETVSSDFILDEYSLGKVSFAEFPHLNEYWDKDNRGRTVLSYNPPSGAVGRNAVPTFPIIFNKFHEDDVNWLWGRLLKKETAGDQDIKRTKVIWDEMGNLRPQDGVSLVMLLDHESEVYRNILSIKEQIGEALNKVGLGHKVKFNPLDSLHMTFASLDVDRQNNGKHPLTDQEINALNAKIGPILNQAQAMTFGVRGINVTPAFSVAVKVAPLRGQNDPLVAIKTQLAQNIGTMVADKLQFYVVSLGYVVDTLSNEELVTFRRIIEKFRNIDFGFLPVNNISLIHHRHIIFDEGTYNIAATYNLQAAPSSPSTSLRTGPSDTPQSSSPITPQEAQALIKGKLAPEYHHLISDTHVQLAMAYEGNFEAAYHAGPPERIEITRAKAVDQSSPSTPLGTSSLVVESRQSSDVRLQSSVVSHQSSDGEESLTTEDGRLTTNPGGIDMNLIDLDREGAGVDIQFDPAQLQELIDAGIDGFAPVIINITPLPSILPLLGLEPANKEEELEVSRLN